MKLGPSGNISIDPSVIGSPSFRWPGRAPLMGYLADDIFDIMFRLHAEERSRFTALLLSRNRVAGIIAIALGNLDAIRAAERVPVRGFDVDKAVAALEFFEAPIDLGSYSRLGRWKAHLALWMQRAALRLVDLLAIPRPVFQISNELPEAALRQRWFWRVRGFPLLLGRGRDLAAWERSALDAFVARVSGLILELVERHDIPALEAERQEITAYLAREMAIAYADFLNLRDWFSGNRTDFYGGSVCGYGRALLALVARESGGDAHATIHGGNVFASTNAANVFEFVNATVSWVPSEQARDNAREMMRLRCPALQPCTIKVHERNELRRYIRNVRHAEAPNSVRTVLVMGVQVVLQVAGLSVLPAPCYADVEKRLTDVLLAAGFDVIYKPHPENSWRSHKDIMDHRVSIEAGRYEHMDRPFEAVIYVHPYSSTLISDLGSNRHIFVIKDGWHDRFWLPSIFPLIERRCEIVPGQIDARGRIDFDPGALVSRLRKPRGVDPSLFGQYIGSAGALASAQNVS